MTYAPGPWQVHGKTIKSVDHQRYYTVARVDNDKFTPEANAANARLIAAAPDLLAAAIDALETFERRFPDSPTAHDLRAAIARATGEA